MSINEKIKEKEFKKLKPTSDLNIIEWRYNQFLGEKISYRDIKKDPNNETFQVTDIKFSNDSSNIIVSDKGGRIIIFKNNEYKGKQKLDYFFEFPAQEKDFDVHKSIEYSEEIKGIDIFPIDNYDRIDILSAGFRTIKIDRVYKDKTFIFDNLNNKKLTVPKLNSVKNEIKVKNKKTFKCNKCSGINSLNLNKFVTNNFLSSDEFRVYLWDVNSINSDVYVPINIEIEDENINNIEKITKTKYSNFNPHIFFYGTNKGLIKLCDLRTNSEQIKFETNYSDTNSNLKDIIGNSLLSIHDICSSYNNENNFVTRHYFNINIWDIRKQNEPISKFLIYEPIIKELQYLYQNNYLNDKFTIDSDINGKYILTGGYNNMFHIFDIEQKLNTQMVIDETNDKLMNTNIIRKINSKGSCFYKKDDPYLNKIDFDRKITHQAFCPNKNFLLIVVYNCIYTYCGNIEKKIK